MKKDRIADNHPVFLATKATAKLYEASFNASLATATKGLAPVAELVDTPSTAVHFPSAMTVVGTSRNNNNDDNNEQQMLSTKTKSCGYSCSSSSMYVIVQITTSIHISNSCTSSCIVQAALVCRSWNFKSRINT